MKGVIRMWQAIQYVGTPLALIAFLAAIAAYIINVRTNNVRDLIGMSPEASRADLIAGLLRDFKVVNVDDLTRSQRFEIVSKILDEKRYRLKIIAISLLAVFLLLCLLLGFTYYQRGTERHQPATSTATPTLPPSSAPVAQLALTYEPVVAYRDVKIQKPTSWLLINDGEHPTFSVENPDDPSVYITISPENQKEYEQIPDMDCKFSRNISAGSGAGPESDGLATLDVCHPVYDGKKAEELVLFINARRLTYAIRCGYDLDKASIYRSVCNTIVGTARYVGSQD